MRRIPYNSNWSIDYDSALEAIKEELKVKFKVPDDVYILNFEHVEYVIIMKKRKPTIYGFKLSYINIFSTSYCGLESYKVGEYMYAGDEETRLDYFPSELGEEDYNYILDSLLDMAALYNIPLREKIEKLPRNYPTGIKISISELLMGDKMLIFTDKDYSENIGEQYLKDIDYLEEIKNEHKELTLEYQACYEMIKKDLRITSLVKLETGKILLIVRVDFDRFTIIPVKSDYDSNPYILTLEKNEPVQRTSVNGLVHIELPSGDIQNIIKDIKQIFSL